MGGRGTDQTRCDLLPCWLDLEHGALRARTWDADLQLYEFNHPRQKERSLTFVCEPDTYRDWAIVHVF